MATPEERMRILKMVEDGTLTPEQGVQLLSALTEAAKDKRGGSAGAPPPPPPGTPHVRHVRVRVTDTRNGRQQVNLRVPIGVVNLLFRAGGKFRTNINGVDHDALLNALHSDMIGPVMDVVDNNGNERVEIIME